eukprot:532468_1
MSTEHITQRRKLLKTSHGIRHNKHKRHGTRKSNTPSHMIFNGQQKFEHYYGQQHTVHDIQLHFREKKGVEDKISSYVFRNNYPYLFVGVWNNDKNIHKYKCIAGKNSCPAMIYHNINDDAFTYFYVDDAHKYCLYAHKQNDPNCLLFFEFGEKLKEKVRCGERAGAACRAGRRDDPELGKASGGFGQFKSKLYYHKKNKFGTLPMNRGEFGPFLIKTGLDGNYYAQKLLRKDYEPDAPDRLINQWKERSGKFYIGDGASRGKYQHFACKWGAEILGQLSSIVISRISVDLTFKSTPKASPKLRHPILYDGAMIIWGGWENFNHNYVPFSCSLAISLYIKAKSSKEEYIQGLESLECAVEQEYKMKIFEKKFDIDAMTDLENPLFTAIGVKFRCDNKLCGYHYCHGLDVNINKKGLSVFTRSDGKHYDILVLYWVRQYKSLMVIHPELIFRCHNLILYAVKDLIPLAHQACYDFHNYHKGYYMRIELILKWNHWGSLRRTNNEQEKGNCDINKFVGPHTPLDDWSYRMGRWFNDKYLDYVSYQEKGVQNKRHTTEILKNKLLVKVWDFMDRYQEDKDLLIGMKYASVALKGNKTTLEKVLKRKVFYDRNT